MASLRPEMVAQLPMTGASDPIAFYRKPLIGRVFLRRVNMGLELIPQRRFSRSLEVGYGAGALFMALNDTVDEMHGIDLDAEPDVVAPLLASQNVTAKLAQGSVLNLPYEDATFDLVVSFSTFEHIVEYRKALSEVHRVLQPGGLFLLGMPAVNPVMEVGFHVIGFRDIDHHHVTRPQQVRAGFKAAGFSVDAFRRLGLPLPMATLYYNWLLRKT